jgi:hypothetical protein
MHKEQHNIGLNPYLKIQNYTIVSEDSNTQYIVLFCYGVPYRWVSITRTPQRHYVSPIITPLWGVRVIGTRRYLCSSTLYNAIGGLRLLRDG